jgi:pilus assembly protein CpaF
LARLSSYSQKAAHEILAKTDSEQVDSRLKDRVRFLLYEKLSSEKIAQYIADGRNVARIELSAAIDQILSYSEFSELSKTEKSAITSDLLKMILGLGPIENLLNDDDVTEIMVNGPCDIFYEKDGRIFKSDESFHEEEQLRMVVDRIVSPLGRRVDEQSPIVNARLQQGHRVNVVIPPVSLIGTSLTIRKFKAVAMSLEDMVALGSLTDKIAQLLTWAVLMRKNIAVSGGTGGGKTTLLNALSQKIPWEERIITIEDSAELRFDKHPHVVRLEARAANSEGFGQVSIRDLVINALRMRPDRIVVGECRGAEAIDMLQAMNTGHDGSLTTLHANSPAELVPRLVMMVRYGMDLPTEIIEAQVASALDIVVQQDRVSGGHRRITQVVMRNPTYARDGIFFKPVVTWNFVTKEYEWESEPSWIEELQAYDIASSEEVQKWRCSE